MKRRLFRLAAIFMTLAGCPGQDPRSAADAGQLDDALDDASRDAAAVREAGALDARSDVEACAPGLDPELHQAILEVFAEALPVLQERLNPVEVQANPSHLYTVQLLTANLLLYTELYRDRALLEQLAALYDLAYGSLVLRDRVHYYYAPDADGVVRRDVVRDLDPPARMWTYPATGELEVGAEAVLAASQLLYAISRTVRLISEVPQPSAALQSFVSRWVPVLRDDHYHRWLERAPGEPGSFQVRGWACAEGTFDHREHLANLLARRYGTAALGMTSDKSYCNAVTDTDLWIAAGVLELVAAHQLDPASVPLAPGPRSIFSDEITKAAELMAARHGVQNLQHEGVLREVAVFDPGSFDDHRDLDYAGFTATSDACSACLPSCPDSCAEFPGWKDAANQTPRVPRTPAIGVGWDLSHARRLPPVFDTFYRHRDVEGTTFPSLDQIAAYARQLAFVVWNGQTATPRFTNFFDGTDGWYRVNYSNRPAFGYAPGVMTETVGTFGYGFWAPLEPRLGQALDAVRALRVPTASTMDRLLYLPEQAAGSLYAPVCRAW